MRDGVSANCGVAARIEVAAGPSLLLCPALAQLRTSGSLPSLGVALLLLGIALTLGGVSTAFPLPTWQAGIGVPTSGRGVPDVAANADPQTGYQVIYPQDQEVDIPGAGRVGIECTAPAGVNCRGSMVLEE